MSHTLTNDEYADLVRRANANEPTASAPKIGLAGMDLKLEFFRSTASALVKEAAEAGVVLTIEQQPLKPLAMGHHQTVVGVREARRG